MLANLRWDLERMTPYCADTAYPLIVCELDGVHAGADRLEETERTFFKTQEQRGSDPHLGFM